MRLPDPFQRRSDQSQQDEVAMRQAPRIAASVQTALTEPLKAEIDSYLQTRGPVSFLQDLPSKLLASTIAGQMAANAAQAAVAAGQGNEQAQRTDTASTSDGATPSANATSLPGVVSSQQSCNRYNVSVLNAVVLYVGMQAIEQLQLKSQPLTMSTIAHTAFMDIYQNLAVSLDTEGRYLFFNAIANQLRYPNAHTHFFSLTLLYLFLEANSQIIQEQITRILFERLVALRPHPWGLLTTFIDLIKDDTYGFWNLEFTRCAPEIEKLFQSVAESCMVKQQSSAVEQ